MQNIEIEIVVLKHYQISYESTKSVFRQFCNFL